MPATKKASPKKKKQTRRSISVSGVTYNMLHAYCRKNKITMSRFVDARITEFFVGDQVQVQTNGAIRVQTKSGRIQTDEPNQANEPKTKLSDTEARVASKIFTF